ncbi:hypothetical protein [Eubacterium sp.]|uniref:hypothetical protein n=1 Tax=Eubacterium sp. TaxID=142586 RepID=UPI003F0539FC
MKNKKSTILFIVFSVIIFIASAVTTGVAIKAGNDYKGAAAAIELYKNSEFNFGPANLTAQTDSARDNAEQYKKTFKKFFAISLLLYLALIIMLVLIYINTVKANELEEETKRQE